VDAVNPQRKARIGWLRRRIEKARRLAKAFVTDVREQRGKDRGKR
jgi:hypothetical protein